MSLSLILQSYNSDEVDQDNDDPASEILVKTDKTEIYNGGEGESEPMSMENLSIPGTELTGTNLVNEGDIIHTPNNDRLRKKKRGGNWMWTSKNRRRLLRYKPNQTSKRNVIVKMSCWPPVSTPKRPDLVKNGVVGVGVEDEEGEGESTFSPMVTETTSLDIDDEGDDDPPEIDYYGPVIDAPDDMVDKSLKPAYCRTVHDPMNKASNNMRKDKPGSPEVEPFKCPFCLQIFSGREVLIDHLRTRHASTLIGNQTSRSTPTDAPMEIDLYCDKNDDITNDHDNDQTESPSSLNKVRPHMKANNLMRSNPNKCNKCGLSLCSATNLKRHMNIHNETADRQWKCSKCPSFFKDSSGLRTHETLVHRRKAGPTKYTCRVCGKKFVKSKLLVHMRIHNNEKPFQCPKCGKRFTQLVNLKSHLAAHHGIELSTKELKSSLEYSSADFESGRQSENPPIMKLDVRDDISQTGKQMESDNKNNQRNGGGSETKSKSRKCHLCEISFFSKKNLERHMAVHQEGADRPWKCLMCYGFFKSSNTLALHENVAHNRQQGSSKYPCQVCLRKFSRSHLKHHMRIHNQERPFSCPLCHRRFRQMCHIKVHLKTIHGKTWSNARLNSLSYTSHPDTNSTPETNSDHQIKTEEGIQDNGPESSRPESDKTILAMGMSEGGNEEKQAFRCPYCLKVSVDGKEFIEHLRSHNKVHKNKTRVPLKKSAKGNWRCTVCRKGFSHPTKLTIHIRIHSGEKPFECWHCLQRFRQSCHLQNHLKSIHGEEKAISELRPPQERPHSPQGSSPLPSKMVLEQDIASRFQLQPCKIILRRCDSITSALSKTRGKSLPKKSGPRRHMISSKDPNKPYKCSRCFLRFTLRKSLHRHLQLHSAKRRYYDCPSCQKRFSNPANLKRHVLVVHQGKKRYQCRGCNKAFFEKSARTKHERRIHPNLSV